MSLKQISKAVLFYLFFIVSLTDQRIGFASSCCAGGGGQSLCVLPFEQRYQLGISTNYRTVTGHFDPYGDYTPLSPGDSYHSVITTLGGAYRLTDEWQLGMSVPIVHNENTVLSKSHIATVFGDPALEGRYTVFEDLAFLPYRPALTLYSGLRFPLGRSVYNSSDPYNTDVVGDGTTTLHFGINASKIIRPIKISPFKISMDGTYFYPISKRVVEMRGVRLSDPYPLKSGNRFQAIESLAYLLNEKWSASLGLKELWIQESKINGSSVDGSAGRIFSSIGTVNYFMNASWAFDLAVESSFPFYQYLANQANVQSISIGAIYGGF